VFFVAVHSSAIEDWEPNCISTYESVNKLARGVRVDDGLLLFNWSSENRTASIKALGVIKQSDRSVGTVSVSWKEVNFDIHPGPQGFRHWRDRWIVRLVPTRVIAYGLKERFAEAFGDKTFLTARIDSGFILRKEVNKDIESIIPEQGYVYLMYDGELWKIGKALNIASRKKQLERQVGKPLELLHSIKSDDYSRAEAEMHFRYRHCRIRGEWFDLKSHELEAIRSLDTLDW
jgi:hypothetical protein